MEVPARMTRAQQGSTASAGRTYYELRAPLADRRPYRPGSHHRASIGRRAQWEEPALRAANRSDSKWGAPRQERWMRAHRRWSFVAVDRTQAIAPRVAGYAASRYRRKTKAAWNWPLSCIGVCRVARQPMSPTR